MQIKTRIVDLPAHDLHKFVAHRANEHGVLCGNVKAEPVVERHLRFEVMDLDAPAKQQEREGVDDGRIAHVDARCFHLFMVHEKPTHRATAVQNRRRV